MGVRITKRTMEFVMAKKMEPKGDRKNRTVAAIVRMGVARLAILSSLSPPPPPGGRL